MSSAVKDALVGVGVLFVILIVVLVLVTTTVLFVTDRQYQKCMEKVNDPAACAQVYR